MVQLAHDIKITPPMSLIIRQLEIQQVISSDPAGVEPDYARLAKHAWLWRIQYQAHCAHLVALLNPIHLTPQNTLMYAAEIQAEEIQAEEIQAEEIQAEEIQAEIQAALKLAGLLEALHAQLHEFPLANRFQQDRQILENLTSIAPEEHTESTPITPFNFPAYVQQVTFQSVTLRLLTGPPRRICLGLITFPETFGPHLDWAKRVVNVLGPILTRAGFLIYLPRTILNALLLPMRLFENQTIPFTARFLAHCEIDDRLFNIINDFPSIISGTL